MATIKNMHKNPRILLKPIAMVVLWSLSGVPAWANNLIVNDLADPGLNGDGKCALREAINNADSNLSGGDCAAGTGADTISFSVSGTILLNSTLNVIDAAGLTLDGVNQRVTLSGNQSVRVLHIWRGANLTLKNLTVANGFINDHGAGIYNDFGILNVINSTLSSNIANDNATGIHRGGGIANNGNPLTGEGNLNVVNSTFTGNASNGGGAIVNANGILSVVNSTFAGNSVTNHICPPGQFCTSSLDEGGAIQNMGIGTLNIDNSIVVGNSAPAAPDISGSVNTASYNLIGDRFVAYRWDGVGPFLYLNGNNGNISGFDVATVLNSTLNNSIGPTPTLALIAGSPAIDAANDTICAASPVNNLDQRGISRPQGPHCDMGAFEVAMIADLAVSGSFTPNPVINGDRYTAILKVANIGPNDATGITLIDTLPLGSEQVTASTSQGTCSAFLNGKITCNLGSLANNAPSATITITGIAKITGALSNQATVSSVQIDNQPTNNTVTQTFTVIPPTCKGLTPTIVGTANNDTLNGTSSRDIIQAMGGNDTINGNSGDDIICGGEGQDSLMGGSGKDYIDGGAGTDVCDGGKDTDSAVNCEVKTNIP